MNTYGLQLVNSANVDERGFFEVTVYTRTNSTFATVRGLEQACKRASEVRAEMGGRAIVQDHNLHLIAHIGQMDDQIANR